MDPPDFQSLAVGTRVVFNLRGCYANESWYFGTVVGGRRGAKACRLVATASQDLDSSPVTVHTKVTPLWDQPLEVHAVAVGRGRSNTGLQYLKGFDRVTESMLFIPLFDGVYEEGRSYVDCADFP